MNDEPAGINNDLEGLFEATGVPAEKMELIFNGDTMPDALGKFTRNLTRCMNAFKEGLKDD